MSGLIFKVGAALGFAAVNLALTVWAFPIGRVTGPFVAAAVALAALGGWAFFTAKSLDYGARGAWSLAGLPAALAPLGWAAWAFFTAVSW